MAEADLGSTLHVGPPGLTFADQLAHNVEALQASAREEGVRLFPPIIALGMSERVGSNWFLETIAKSADTHNEPFRQQLHASHPLSTIVSRPLAARTYRAEEMHPYEAYWLNSFVLSKYSTRPQLLKETNLFFATGNLLDLFPDANPLVLAREPIGIVSSFANSDLFRKWNYAERYNQLRAMALQPQYADYGFVFEGEHDPGSLRKLTRLIVLNTLLISSALAGRSHMVVSYEASVRNRREVLEQATQFLMDQGIDLELQDLEVDLSVTSDHVFSTRKVKNELIAHLDPEDVAVIKAEVRRLLADSLAVLSETQYADAQALLEPDESSYRAAGRLFSSQPTVIEAAGTEKPKFEYVSTPDNHEWANQPVCNRDFVLFLNDMHQEGIPNVINGTQLFVNENMIPSRGGRIWFNSNSGRYEVTPGFEDHPVYWVTWLGAAAYARYYGARLPDREEIEVLVQTEDADFEHINAGHRLDDANQIGQYLPNNQGIYDLIGNVASWCRDGFSEIQGRTVNRYIFGTAWNRDATIDELKKPKSRPISGCSRSVGIRLIRDEDKRIDTAQLAERFEGWFRLMAHQSDASKTDRYIIDQLTY